MKRPARRPALAALVAACALSATWLLWGCAPAADIEALLGDLGVDISRLLHGEQEFEHFKPIRPGETYLCRSRITDIYEKTGKSGPMAFVVRETAVTDQTNEIVLKMRHITVIRL